MLEDSGFSADMSPRAFVCGSTPLVEQAAADLVALGYMEAWVKTERFGPTGDAK
jgi:ferredoxin-NADP reductase